MFWRYVYDYLFNVSPMSNMQLQSFCTSRLTKILFSSAFFRMCFTDHSTLYLFMALSYVHLPYGTIWVKMFRCTSWCAHHTTGKWHLDRAGLTCVSVSVCEGVCVWGCLCESTYYVCVCVCERERERVHVCLCVSLSLSLSLSHTHTHTHTHTHAHTQSLSFPPPLSSI